MITDLFPLSWTTGSVSRSKRERGVALLIALILLLVITLVGLAAIHTTLMQNEMSSSQYDKQLAFQSSDAALKVAANLIPSSPNIIARDCQDTGTVCGPNPFKDPTLPTGSVYTVTAGNSVTQYTASPASAMQPQFVVESLGTWIPHTQNTGFNNTSNSRNYGVQGSASSVIYYRITARSCDPSAAQCSGRANVVLQSIVRAG